MDVFFNTFNLLMMVRQVEVGAVKQSFKAHQGPHLYTEYNT